MTLPPKEPQADLLGGVPEEDIVFIGDDTYVYFIVPEELPMGQDTEVRDSDINDPDPL